MSTGETHKGPRLVRSASLLAESIEHNALGVHALAAEIAALQEQATRYTRLKFELERLAETSTDISPDELRRMVARVETT